MRILKVRKGFVTNSSSSSFILGFKDEDSIARTLAEDNVYDYFSTIYQDCLDAEKMDLETMLNNYKEEIEGDIHWGIIWTYEDKHGRLPWDEIREFEKTDEYKERYEKKLNECIDSLRKESEGKSVFVEVEYEDHDCIGSQLEHEIVPNLNCCLRRISHH